MEFIIQELEAAAAIIMVKNLKITIFLYNLKINLQLIFLGSAEPNKLYPKTKCRVNIS